MINLFVNLENAAPAINTAPPSGLVLGLYNYWLLAQHFLTKKSEKGGSSCLQVSES